MKNKFPNFNIKRKHIPNGYVSLINLSSHEGKKIGLKLKLISTEKV